MISIVPRPANARAARYRQGLVSADDLGSRRRRAIPGAGQAPEIAPFEPQYDIGLVERRIHFQRDARLYKRRSQGRFASVVARAPIFRLRIWGSEVRILRARHASVKPSTTPKELDFQSLRSLPVVSIGGIRRHEGYERRF